MVEKKQVIIDLFEPNLPGAINSSEFVQQALKHRLVSDIKDLHCDSIEQKNDLGIISESGRQVFFIDGTRGAGKTTFMNEIVSSFKQDYSDMHVLRCIDPTKLPQMGPILITVIAQLNSDVSYKLRLKSGWDSGQSQDKEEWQRLLKNISRAIQLLDKKETTSEFFDDAMELNWQLHNASDGLGLEEMFSRLLEKACEILKCKAVLVAFDDIDTQFNTGWHVLEAIRKYFTSPQLVILLTGDLRLYSQLIRGKQYSNYDPTMLKEEASELDKQSRSVMVNHLEQQYLIKLLPVHRRTYLKSLYQLVDDKNNEYPIYVKTNQVDEAKSLNQAVKQMLTEGLHLKKDSDVQLYANELLKQPIRLVIQLLQRYYQQRSDTPHKSCAEMLNEVTRDTMLSNIYKAGLTYDNTNADVEVIARDIFSYTLMDGDTNTGFYLRPQSESEVLRSSSFYLSSIVSRGAENSLWKTLYLILTGCGSVSLYDRLVQRYSSKLSKSDIEQACRTYLGLGRAESLTHWANRSNAALCPINQDNLRGVHPGLLRLNRSPSRDRVNGTETYNSTKEKSFLARLAVDTARSDLAGNNVHSFISITNLLGGIAELVSSSAEANTDVSDIKATLAKMAFVTTCSAPPWAQGDNTDIDEQVIEDSPVEELINEYSDEGIQVILNWLEIVRSTEQEIRANSVLFGKIWTRLYFNLVNIAEEHAKNLGTQNGLKGTNASDTNAAKIMRFNVIALLHGVLFEEDAYHHNEHHSLFTKIDDRKNPLTTVKEFASKLKSLDDDCESPEEIGKRLPIFYLLITCPLLHPFLFADGSILSSKQTKSKEEEFLHLMKKLTSKLGKNYNPEDHKLTELCKASITSTKGKPAPRKPSTKQNTTSSKPNLESDTEES
ncbi:hypothetical protein NRI58_003489 [Vibrio parahaemolyticus]|nr:hypothetical protein [Vibrio parahaemolyticus]ELB2263783.1 hypothetical protein [Vibrio parahaemolyticus]